MARKIISSICLISVALLFLTSCGADTYTTDEVFAWEWDMDAPSPFEGETLTVATVWAREMINAAITGYVQAGNRGVDINITNLGSDLDRASEQLGIQLMAGTAPMLIVGDIVDIHNPNTAQLFVDWIPIMRADPRFNEDAWAMNIIDGLSNDGALYAFPASVFYNSIAVNNNVPGLVQATSDLDVISLDDMIELHTQFSDQDKYMLWGFDVLFAVEANIGRFFDFSTQYVDFVSQEFIDLLNISKNLTSPSQTFGNRDFSMMSTRDAEISAGSTYLFALSSNYSFQRFPVFEDEDPFVNPMFFVNGSGEIMITQQEYFAFILNAQATPLQRALAWDFVNSLIDTATIERHSGGWTFNLHHHVSKNLQEHHANDIKANVALQFFTSRAVPQPWRLKGDWDDFSAVFLNQYTAAEQIPMTNARYAPDMVTEAVFDILQQFHDGLITAETAANDLQNRITLILMEMG